MPNIAIEAPVGEENVKRHGATGNGSTDDRAAINAAATAPGVKTVVFGPGTYRMASALTIAATVAVKVHPGAILAPDVGVVVTIKSQVDALRQQWISVPTGNVRNGTEPGVVIDNGQPVYPEWWGATGDGTTNDTKPLMQAMYALPVSGGIVQCRPVTYMASGIWPITYVTLDLNGATLNNLITSGYGILDHTNTTYKPTAAARQTFGQYHPLGGGYTGGFYNIAGTMYRQGEASVTMETPAEAANFAAGDYVVLFSGRNDPTAVTTVVAESQIVASADAGTGLITFRWPLHKTHKKNTSHANYRFGIAKRDVGWASGEGFVLENGTLDNGSNPGRYMLNYEGYKMTFRNLSLQGDARAYYNIRGTKCTFSHSYVHAATNTGSSMIFGIDQGATDNVISHCRFDLYGPTPVSGLFIHLGELHSDTKFLYNEWNFPPRTVAGNLNAGESGLSGMTWIGNTFRNFPITPFVGPGAWDPDGLPITHKFIGNEFLGEFYGRLIFTGVPSATPDPTTGFILFTENTVIGTMRNALIPSGSNDRLIADASRCIITNNLFRVVNDSTGDVNRVFPGNNFDQYVLKDNIGIPDVVRRTYVADNFVNLSGATVSTVQGWRVLSLADAATQSGDLLLNLPSQGGKYRYHVKLLLVNMGAGSGDVVIRLSSLNAIVGTALTSTLVTGDTTVTAGAQDVPFETGWILAPSTGGADLVNNAVWLRISRIGASGSDTLGNSIGLLGIEVALEPRMGY